MEARRPGKPGAHESVSVFDVNLLYRTRGDPSTLGCDQRPARATFDSYDLTPDAEALILRTTADPRRPQPTPADRASFS